MKIRFTLEFDTEDRLAIATGLGLNTKKPADRQTIIDWVEQLVKIGLDDFHEARRQAYYDYLTNQTLSFWNGAS